MLIVIRREYLRTLILAAMILSGMGAVLWHGADPDAKQAGGTAMLQDDSIYVIDAGHGGEDGGAVAGDGTVESQLNLEIARRTANLLQFCGASIEMTRWDGAAIYSEGAVTLREKKVSDLKNRAAMVNRLHNSVLVSIHQNSLPQSPKVSGAQVFYNSQDGAEILASSIQDQLNLAVNAGGEKSCKRISDTIYLMKHVTAPAVLIECGFLSNQEETARLQSGDHQKKLALAITAGLWK